MAGAYSKPAIQSNNINDLPDKGESKVRKRLKTPSPTMQKEHPYHEVGTQHKKKKTLLEDSLSNMKELCE